MPVGTKEYIGAWLKDKAETMSTAVREVAKHCSEQTIYHMLKSIVSKNSHLVSCLPSKLTKQYTETVDHALGTTALNLFHPDTTALSGDCRSKSRPNNVVKTKQVLWLRCQLPHRMQGLGILTSTPRRTICYGKAVAATFGTNLPMSAKAVESLHVGYAAVKHEIITRAERDADVINPSDAFRKCIKQAMDALTVRKEMDKFLIKKQEMFRDFAMQH
jgi:hypothetical protein